MSYLRLPFPVLLAVALAAVALRRRRVALAALLGLLLWAWPPFAWLVNATLELGYPPSRFPSGDPQAIVVLSSGMIPPNPSLPQPTLDLSSSLRTRHAAWLYRNWRAVPVLASGGASNAHPRIPVAQVMKRVLEGEGVPADSVWTESESHSTWENAVFSARLLAARGIRRVAVVTETHHMWRSEKCFLAQGLDVIPAPVASRTQQLTAAPHFPLLPSTRVMEWNDDVLHEWLGMAWYRVRGRIR